jgi:signal peptidase I
MAELGRRLLVSFSLACLAVLVSGAIGLVVLLTRHERLLSVQTASMVPTFRPGDALIVKPTKQKPAMGAVITYRSPSNSQVLITHRLVAWQGSQLITAGDAIGSQDRPIARQAVIGEATTVLPGMGRWLDRLHQPVGLLSAVYLPAISVAAFEIHRLLAKLKPPQYRAYVIR